MKEFKSFIADTPVIVHYLIVNNYVEIHKITTEDGRAIHLDADNFKEMILKIEKELKQ